ncbi:MAG: hypothetical protein ABIX00_00840 [Polaromonas sp.]
MKLLLIAAALSALCAPAWAVNKCTGPDGKVTYQDAPCTNKGGAIEVRPASGHAPATPAPLAVGAQAAPKKQTEADRLNASTAASQRERRKADLDERLVPYANDAIYRQRAECDQQLSALKAQKLSAKNNLAGATWEGSISAEMTAVATRCDTHNRDLREEFSALKKECVALGGCKGE